LTITGVFGNVWTVVGGWRGKMNLFCGLQNKVNQAESRGLTVHMFREEGATTRDRPYEAGRAQVCIDSFWNIVTYRMMVYGGHGVFLLC